MGIKDQARTEDARTAPTEKHLENWIVAHNGWLLAAECPDLMSEHCVVARQLRLPSGIADLVIADPDYLHIMELKKGAIDEKAIAQVLRYRGDFLSIWHATTHNHAMGFLESRRLFPEIVFCVLIGQSADDSVLRSCLGAGIAVYLYEFDGEDYHFSYFGDRRIEMQDNTAEEFSYGTVGQFMSSAIKGYFGLTDKAEWIDER